MLQSLLSASQEEGMDDTLYCNCVLLVCKWPGRFVLIAERKGVYFTFALLSLSGFDKCSFLSKHVFFWRKMAGVETEEKGGKRKKIVQKEKRGRCG